MRQVGVILLVIVMTPGDTFSAQYFSSTPKYTEVNPGSAVVLSCVVSENSSLSECVCQHDRQAEMSSKVLQSKLYNCLQIKSSGADLRVHGWQPRPRANLVAGRDTAGVHPEERERDHPRR